MGLDILFDVFLVKEYASMDQDCLTAEWKTCHLERWSTSCGLGTTEPVPKGDGTGTFCLLKSMCAEIANQTVEDNLKLYCAPLKLAVKPRFYYSLGFIICPWVFYFTEFLQSGICSNISQV